MVADKSETFNVLFDRFEVGENVVDFGVFNFIVHDLEFVFV